ncbi:MFS transporter [Pseudonocardia lacus]|uniref:MFS transporter n=1 Tax=Pseudonocardia lacus TaxID=2835865 RepID=UPI0020286101|nr:MFS transporter [Pseudonocardia lacus]
MHASVGAVPRRATEAAFAALLLGMLMAQLDGNIVVAALPAVGADLRDPDAIAGVTAAYLLTVTAATPVHGRLGDLFGRRAAFAASVLVFAVGSALCALAPSLGALVAARALQGVGGGGLVVSAVTALGEMFDRAERVRRQVWVTAAFGVSALAGPPVGALLAAGPGWRWAFVINPPLCALALALGLRGLPGRRADAAGGFDVAGAVLVVLGGGCVVLLGSSEALATGPAAVPLVVGALLAGALFARRQRRAPAPLFPPALLAAPGLARTIAVTGLGGVALFGSFTFVPAAVAAGTGLDTGAVGASLVALTGGQLVIGLVFAALARRWSRMVPWGRLGLATGVAGLAALAVVPRTGGPAALAVALAGMALTGAALGLCLQAYTLLGQACAPPEAFGAAMAALTFARQLGGAIGAAALGWLLLAVPDRTTGLAAVLAAAALVLVVALPLAPRRADEPAH